MMPDTATELIALAAGVDFTLDEPRGPCTFCGSPAELPYNKAVSANFTDHERARTIAPDGNRYVCPACKHTFGKSPNYRSGCWIVDSDSGQRKWAYGDRVDWLENVLALGGKGYQTPAVFWMVPYGARYHVAPWTEITYGTGAALVRYGRREVVVRHAEHEPLWRALIELFLLGVGRDSLMYGVYTHWDAANGGARFREYRPLLDHHRPSGLTTMMAECLSADQKKENDVREDAEPVPVRPGSDPGGTGGGEPGQDILSLER